MHGNLRCRNLLVSQMTSNSLLVRIGDPGMESLYNTRPLSDPVNLERWVAWIQERIKWFFFLRQCPSIFVLMFLFSRYSGNCDEFIISNVHTQIWLLTTIVNHNDNSFILKVAVTFVIILFYISWKTAYWKVSYLWTVISWKWWLSFNLFISKITATRFWLWFPLSKPV